MTTLLGVPLGILPQVIDTRYFFCFKKYNALITHLSMPYSNNRAVLLFLQMSEIQSAPNSELF